LPWTTLAVLVHPTLGVAAAYWGLYLVFRGAMTWLIGIRGLKQGGLWKKMPLIPVWDGLAFFIWLGSFTRTTIRWRGADYKLRNGHFVSAMDNIAADTSAKTLPRAR